MKKIILVCLVSFNLFAAVPSDENLLRNVNNASINGAQITLKAEVKKMGDSTENLGKAEYVKIVLGLGETISLLQVNYSNSQMQANQLLDVKYTGDLSTAVSKNNNPDLGMFYSVVTMLGTNKSGLMETFIEKMGSGIIKNKSLVNEDKLKLIRNYKNYLVSTKGKGEATSPLNPQEPAEKAKVIELFKSNTFQRSSNIELVKENNEFMWKADWKTVKGYFSNEERRLKALEIDDVTTKARLDIAEYIMFNNVNEFPRTMVLKDTAGEIYKITFYGQEVKKVLDKKLSDRFDEAKKQMTKTNESKDTYKFLF